VNCGSATELQHGTYLLKNIRSVGSSAPSQFAVMNDVLYFSANSDDTGEELWKTDGTSAGTKLVKNIRGGSSGSYPTYLTSINGELFLLPLSHQAELSYGKVMEQQQEQCW
jgi:ELWxxDGT repeat protein